MNKINVFQVKGKKNRWGLNLVDEVIGSRPLSNYARRTTAFRGAKRIISGPVGAVLVKNTDGTWTANAKLANKTIVPLASYQRKTTALRGVNRFQKRLATSTVCANA